MTYFGKKEVGGKRKWGDVVGRHNWREGKWREDNRQSYETTGPSDGEDYEGQKFDESEKEGENIDTYRVFRFRNHETKMGDKVD